MESVSAAQKMATSARGERTEVITDARELGAKQRESADHQGTKITKRHQVKAGFSW
jgi:hypothetical protein